MELFQEGVELRRRREGARAAPAEPPRQRAQPRVILQPVDIRHALPAQQVQQQQRLDKLTS